MRARNSFSLLRIFGLVALVLFAGAALTGNRRDGGPVRHEFGAIEFGYQLETRSQIKYGSIRRYPETEYTFWQVKPDGSRTKLWQQTIYDKYATHWIGAGGNLWVLRDAMPGPGQGSGIWVRDVQGAKLADWPANLIFPELPDEPRSPRSPVPGHSGRRLSAGELRQRINEQLNPSLLLKAHGKLNTFKDGEIEELTLPTTKGYVQKVVASWRGYGGGPIAISCSLEPGAAPPEFMNVATDAKYQPFEAVEPVDGAGLLLWTAKSNEKSSPDFIAFQPGGGPPLFQHNLIDITAVHRVDRPPNKVLLTPGREILWIEDPAGPRGESTVRLFNHQGQQFQQGTWVRGNPGQTGIDDFSIYDGYRWIPLSAAIAQRVFLNDDIEAVDAEGKRHSLGAAPAYRMRTLRRTHQSSD